MILTLALNPSVEKTAIVDGIEINQTNQIQDYRLVLGPSAIYSAYIIKILQGEPCVIGFAGGIGGRYIKNFMDKNRIKSDLLWKDTETRSVIKIVDSINTSETIFIDDTFLYEEQDIKNIKNKFRNHLKNVNVIVINDGTINETISNNIVENIMTLSQESTIKSVVSLTGSKLRKSLEYSPFAVVLNKNDMRELALDHIVEQEELFEALRNIIIKHKIRYIIYDDASSIYSIARHKICRVDYLGNTSRIDFVEYKDFIVGALAISVARKYEMEKIIRLMAAVKRAVVITNYPRVCLRKDIDDQVKKMKVTEVYNKASGYNKTLFKTKK